MIPRQLADEQKLRDWNLTAKVAFTVHYTCGILGVTASTYAATPYPLAKLSAVIAAMCFAVLGFVQPMKVYHKFMSAARFLQHAVDLYESGHLDSANLIEMRYKAEMRIQEMDQKYFVPQKKP